MDRSEHVLLIGADTSLRAEFDGALAGMSAPHVLARHAREMREGLAAARDWRPVLVCLEAPRDADVLKRFASELAADVPEARLALVYGSTTFSDGEAESSYLLTAVRCGVADVLRRPLSSAEMQEVLTRLLRHHVQAMRADGRLVAFVSNKGGVGKSTLAVSTACALSRVLPGRVLLVDASVQLGVAAFMLDLRPETTLLDAVRERDRLDETLLMQLATPHACGLRLLAAPADPVEAAEIEEGSLARVLTLAKRTFDIVIVDTFPMLDGLVLSVLDLADLTYVVTQCSVPGVVGTARLLTTLQGVGCAPASLRVVLNHIHPSHPGRLTEGDVATRIGRPVDHLVPFQRRLLPALDSGLPYILRASRHFGFGGAVSRIAREIMELPGRTPKGNGSGGTDAGRVVVRALVEDAADQDRTERARAGTTR